MAPRLHRRSGGERLAGERGQRRERRRGSRVVNADPGVLLIGAARDPCRTWANQAEVAVPGIHHVQEDSGDEIGREIADWSGSL